jgi:hypothetical protein
MRFLRRRGVDAGDVLGHRGDRDAGDRDLIRQEIRQVFPAHERGVDPPKRLPLLVTQGRLRQEVRDLIQAFGIDEPL